MNEWVKRFILGASLILFAGIVFYIVVPKWHYLASNDGRYRYNSITGEFCGFGPGIASRGEINVGTLKYRFKG